MIILVLFIVLVGSITAYSIIEKKEDSDAWKLLFAGTGWISGITTAALIIIAIVTYPFSLDNLSKMENFYKVNNEVFSKAVASFPDAVRVQTGTNITQTFTLSWDYTKKVLEYNKDLAWYRKYQKHWFIGIFVAKVPNSLHFIKMG